MEHILNLGLGYWNHPAGYPAIKSFIFNITNPIKQTDKSIIYYIVGTIAIS